MVPDRDELKVLRHLGFELTPMTLPDQRPLRALVMILGPRPPRPSTSRRGPTSLRA